MGAAWARRDMCESALRRPSILGNRHKFEGSTWGLYGWWSKLMTSRPGKSAYVLVVAYCRPLPYWTRVWSTWGRSLLSRDFSSPSVAHYRSKLTFVQINTNSEHTAPFTCQNTVSTSWQKDAAVFNFFFGARNILWLFSDIKGFHSPINVRRQHIFCSHEPLNTARRLIRTNILSL